MEELLRPVNMVLNELRSKWQEMNQQEPFIDVLKGFAHAVNWHERWLIGVLAVEGLMLVLALLFRKRSTVQATLFVLAMAVVFNAERLNSLGAQHWRGFASQPYFDKSGVFFSSVVSGPLLLIMFIVLINYLITCAGLLVQAKRQELKYRARQRAKRERTASGNLDAVSSPSAGTTAAVRRTAAGKDAAPGSGGGGAADGQGQTAVVAGNTESRKSR